jgi:hypothetical protein
MKKWTMTEQEFIKEMTRLDEYKDDFSEAGLKALYAYYDEVNSSEIIISFDVVEICHEFTQPCSILALNSDTLGAPSAAETSYLYHST